MEIYQTLHKNFDALKGRWYVEGNIHERWLRFKVMCEKKIFSYDISQPLDGYSLTYWQAIIYYLKGIQGSKICPGGQNDISLFGFTDSD